MQFYSRTSSKTWNALEFIRLFWKHSLALSPCLSVWTFRLCHADAENPMQCRSPRSIPFFNDFEGFDIFVHRATLKSGEIFPFAACMRCICLWQARTMLITCHWIWLEWMASYGGCDQANKYCAHHFPHSDKLKIARKYLSVDFGGCRISISREWFQLASRSASRFQMDFRLVCIAASSNHNRFSNGRFAQGRLG